MVLVSASGASPRSQIFYSRVKGQAEEAVRSLGIPRVVMLRPSLLIGDRTEKRSAEGAAIWAWRALRPVLPRGVAARLGTPVEALVRAMVDQSLIFEPGRCVLEAPELLNTPELRTG